MPSNRPPAADRAPFFIVYDSRSGSTWFSNLLMQTANVAIAPESNFAIKFLEKWGRDVRDRRDLRRALDIVYKEPKFTDWNLKRRALSGALRAELPLRSGEFLSRVFEQYLLSFAPEAKRFGVKKGNYIFHFDELSSLFPESQWIGLIRDGRAVFRSKKINTRSGSGQPFQIDASESAREWVAYIRALRAAENDAPKRVAIVRYESLVERPADEVGAALRFLRIEPDEGASATAQYGVPERYGESLHANINKPALKSRADAWKSELSPDEIAVYETVAGDVLRSEGYELTATDGG